MGKSVGRIALKPDDATYEVWHDWVRENMESEGFRVYEYEWWHFDYKDWNKYGIGNLKFEDIK